MAHNVGCIGVSCISVWPTIWPDAGLAIRSTGAGGPWSFRQQTGP